MEKTAIINSAKHASVKAGEYLINEVFVDGVAIELPDKRIVFVDAEGIGNWSEISASGDSR